MPKPATPPMPLAAGNRVVLCEMPLLTGCEMTVGRVYTVVHLDGSCVCTTTDVAGENATYHHARVRLVTPFSRLTNGGWVCEADGVRFTFFKPTPGCPFRGVDFKGDWWCKAYADSDEWATRAPTRDQGIAELYEIVADARESRDGRRREEELAELEL
jgi:hypothetical protein